MTPIELLLKKHDLPLPMPYGSQYFEAYKARYQAFAKSVIEDYKASLVPVGYYVGVENEYGYDLVNLDKAIPVGTELYALGETK